MSDCRQTFFTGPRSAVRYCYVTATGADAMREPAEERGRRSSVKRGQSESQLIAEIKERWAYGRGRQEEMQKILAGGGTKA